MLLKLLTLALLTAIPALELRFSIPLGIFDTHHYGDIPWWLTAITCIAANVLLGIAIYEVLLPCLAIARKWTWFDQKIWPHFVKRQEKLRPTIEKYGEWGLAIFIGVPLPGTGAVTGAIGAFLLAFDRKRFYLANFFGVLIAGVTVTILCLLIQHGAVAEDSLLRRLFINE